MALPSSGTLTTNQVAQEIWGDNRVFDLTGADARALIGKPSGTIVFPNDFYGKSKNFTITINSPADPASYYGYSDTPNIQFGSITANASVYPDGRLVGVGGVGHIFEFLYTTADPHYGGLYLRIGGTTTDWPSVASLPFNSINVNGHVVAKGNLTFTGGGDHGAGIPIVQFKVAQDWGALGKGNNSVQFLA